MEKKLNVSTWEQWSKITKPQIEAVGGVVPGEMSKLYSILEAYYKPKENTPLKAKNNQTSFISALLTLFPGESTLIELKILRF